MKEKFIPQIAPEFSIDYEINNYNRSDVDHKIDVYATHEELARLEKYGYLKRKEMFSEEEVLLLRQATDRIANEEMQLQEREYYPGNGIFIRYLIDKDPLFQKLLTYPPILSVAKAMLGPQVQLMDLVARVTYLDEPAQKLMWHIHNRVVPNPLPPFFAHPHGLEALIYLDDTNDKNGALCVIPSSHNDVHNKMEFRDHDDKDEQVTIETKAGDCIFSHSNIWHRVKESSESSSNSRRRVLLMGFMPAWFKKNFPKGIKPEISLTDHIRNSSDPTERELLGDFEWI